MSAKDALEQCRHVWDDEIDYAETLRDRRKLFTGALVIAAGLGVFRIDLHVDEGQIRTISSDVALLALKVFVVAAGLLFATGAYFLFRSSKRKGDDVSAPRRASELLELSDDEVDLMCKPGTQDPAAIRLRIEKLRVATLRLAAANRRISENIKTGASLIALGYACLTVCAGIYTLGRDDGAGGSEEVLKETGGMDDGCNRGTEATN